MEPTPTQAGPPDGPRVVKDDGHLPLGPRVPPGPHLSPTQRWDVPRPPGVLWVGVERWREGGAGLGTALCDPDTAPRGRSWEESGRVRTCAPGTAASGTRGCLNLSEIERN